MAADSTLSVDIQATDEASPALKELGNAASEVASKAASAASPVQELGEHAAKAGQQAEEAGGLFGHFKESLMGVGKVAAGMVAGQVFLDMFKGLDEQFTDTIKDTETFGEQVRSLSQNMGITTQDASSLVYGMKELGIATGATTDAAASGISAFTRFSKGIQGVEEDVSGLIPGGKSVTQTLKDMGVATVDTTGKTLPFMQVLEDTADKFKGMQDGTEKTTIASALFGRTYGTQLIPLLNLGRDGIEELAATTQKYGLQLSTDNVQQIREFALAHHDMDAAMEGARLQIGLGLIPVLTDLIKGFSGAIASVRDWLDALNKTFGITDIFKSVVSGIGDAVGRAFATIKQFASEHDFSDWALRIVAYGAVVAEGLGELVGAFGEALGGILQIVISVGELIYEALSYLNPFAPHSPPLVNQVQDGLALIKKEFAGLVDVQPALQALGGGFKELEAALKDTLQSAKDALQDFKASTQLSLDAAKDALQTFKDAAQDRIRAVEDGLQAFKDSVQTSLQAAQDSFSALQQSVQDNIASMQDGLSQLQDAVSATNDQISNLKQQLTDLQNQPVGDEVEIEKAKLAVMQAQVDVDQDGGQASKDSLTTAQAHLKLLQDQHNLAQQTASVNAQPQVTAITAQIAALTTQKTAQGEAVKQKQEEIKAAQQAGQATIKAAQEGLQAQQRAAQEEIKAHEKAAAAAKQAIQDEVKDKQKAYDDDLKAFQGVVKQKEDAIAKLQEAEQAAAAAQSAASAGGKGAGAGGGLAGAIKGAGGGIDLKDLTGGADGIGAKLKAAMDEAKANMGGFKTAIDGAVGSIGEIKAQIDGFEQTLKSSQAKEWAKGIGESLRGIETALAPVAGAIAGFLADNWQPFVVAFAAFKAASFVAGIYEAGAAMLVFAGEEGIAAAASAILDISLAPVALVVLAIAAAVAIGVLAFKNWGSITSAVGGFMSNLGAAVHGAMDAVTGFLDAHRALIPVILLALGPVGLLIAAVGAVVAAFKNWGTITSAVGDFLSNIGTAVHGAMDDLGSTVHTAMDNLGTAVHTAMDNFLNLFKVPFAAIASFFQEWWPLLAVIFTAGLAIPVAQVINHWGQIQAFTTSVWNAISGFISGVVQRIAGFLVPPIQAASDQVQNIWQRVWTFTTTIWTTISTTITHWTTVILQTLVDAGTNFFNTFKAGWDKITGAIAGFLQPIIDAVTTFGGNVVAQLVTLATNAFNEAKQIGTMILQGIEQAIQAGWSVLTDMIGKLAHSLLDAAKQALGIHSPSAMFAEIGQNMMLGLQQGILSGGPSVTATVTHQMEALPAAASGGYNGAAVTPSAGGGGLAQLAAEIRALRADIGSGNVNILMDGQQVATMVRKNLLRQGQSLTTLWGN